MESRTCRVRLIKKVSPTKGGWGNALGSGGGGENCTIEGNYTLELKFRREKEA